MFFLQGVLFVRIVLFLYHMLSFYCAVGFVYVCVGVEVGYVCCFSPILFSPRYLPLVSVVFVLFLSSLFCDGGNIRIRYWGIVF